MLVCEKWTLNRWKIRFIDCYFAHFARLDVQCVLNQSKYRLLTWYSVFEKIFYWVMPSPNFIELTLKLLILWVFEFLMVGKGTHVGESASFNGKMPKFRQPTLGIDRERSIEDPPSNPPWLTYEFVIRRKNALKGYVTHYTLSNLRPKFILETAPWFFQTIQFLSLRVKTWNLHF